MSVCYSAIHHIACSIFLNHDPKQRWFAMLVEFTGYFDESGKSDDKTSLVVAGHLSSVDQWLRFENEWKEAMTDANGNILVFHATDFFAGKGDFTDWNLAKRERLLNKLTGIIRRRVRKQFSITIPIDLYREMNEEYAFQEFIGTPYALACRSIYKLINQWKEKYNKNNNPVRLIFEDGAEHKGDLIEAMQRDELLLPIFEPKSQVVPLQAADLLAWEIHNYVKRGALTPEMETLLEHPYDFGVFLKDDFLNMCKINKHVPPRSQIEPGAKIVFHSLPKRERRRTII